MTPIDQLVEDVRAQLENDPDGHIPRGRREAIWAALGPRDERSAHARRARLAAQAARRVLSLWEEERPGDHLPHDVLALADAALDGSPDREHAVALAGALWGEVDNLIVTAGRSALAAL